MELACGSSHNKSQRSKGTSFRTQGKHGESQSFRLHQAQFLPRHVPRSSTTPEIRSRDTRARRVPAFPRSNAFAVKVIIRTCRMQVHERNYVIVKQMGSLTAPCGDCPCGRTVAVSRTSHQPRRHSRDHILMQTFGRRFGIDGPVAETTQYTPTPTAVTVNGDPTTSLVQLPQACWPNDGAPLV